MEYLRLLRNFKVELLVTQPALLSKEFLDESEILLQDSLEEVKRLKSRLVGTPTSQSLNKTEQKNNNFNIYLGSNSPAQKNDSLTPKVKDSLSGSGNLQLTNLQKLRDESKR